MSLTPPLKCKFKNSYFILLNISFYVNIHVEASTDVHMLLEA